MPGMNAEAVEAAPRTVVRPRNTAARVLTSPWTSLAHPPLLAATFVLFLFAQNIEEQVGAAVVLRPLLIVLLGTAGAMLLALVLFRDLRRAGLATSVAVLLFFTYGHAWELVQGWAQEPVLLAVWVAMLLLALALIALVGRPPRAISDALTVFAAALLVMNALPIFGYHPPVAALQEQPAGLTVGPDAEPLQRDIYYIVLDRYPDARTLSEQFGYDNRSFLDALEERGFYVASDSVANYLKTAFSLVATLEMDYLDMEALGAAAAKPTDWKPLHDRLQGELAVPAFLKANGYRYVHVATWWGGTLTNRLADQVLAYGGTSEFDALLVDTTMLRAADMFGVEAALASRDVKRLHTLFQFSRLEEMASAPGPKFVFAHITLPHDPYVFDADGDYLSEAQARERSPEQNFVEHVEYANRRVLGVVERLLDVPPERQPIIVVGADEGPLPDRFAGHQDTFEWQQARPDEIERKFRILNAFYLPGVEDAGLYPSITSVNAFRLIFNAYFDTDLPLLPDRAFTWFSGQDYYEHFEITEQLLPDP
jgi:hypothetical protein